MKALLISLLLAAPMMAADLEFREAFADPETRTAALERLVPGTRDAFFYRALDHQLARRVEAFHETMARWEAAAKDGKSGVSAEGMEVLKRREILLGYEADPEGAVKRLIDELELKFDDTQPDARADERLPDRLEAEEITLDAFVAEAGRVNDGGAHRAMSQELLVADLEGVADFGEEKVRYLLGALEPAEHPAVATLVLKALALPDAAEFGALPIHGRLTVQQMVLLMVGEPKLLGNQRFAVQYLSRLMPGAEVDFTRDRAAHAAHLVKCRDFVMKLPSALNSLKAHVLYHHLRLQRELGNFPLADFTAYLELPRLEHPLIQPREDVDDADYVRLKMEFRDASGCLPVGDDRELVEALAMHHLSAAETPAVLAKWIEEEEKEEEEKDMRRLRRRRRHWRL